MMDLMTSNPYDNLDKRIKLDFLNIYKLQLNQIHYSVYGIIDEYYLLSLIGESKVFDVYLGYKEGLFFAVKIMKRSLYEDKDVVKERIRSFSYELEIRYLLREYDFFPMVYHVNNDKYVIVEEYLSNGSLSFYSKCSMSGSMIKHIINELTYIVRCLLEMNMVHTYLSLGNIYLSKTLNLKIVGFRQINHKIFHDHYQKETEQLNVDPNTIGILSVLSELLFKEESSYLKKFIQDLIINFNELEALLDILIVNSKLITKYKSIEVIKSIFKSIKLTNSIAPLYSFDWMNFGGHLTTQDFHEELGSFRLNALKDYYDSLFANEKKKLIKKRGLFRVIK